VTLARGHMTKLERNKHPFRPASKRIISACPCFILTAVFAMMPTQQYLKLNYYQPQFF
jgi:hypothetical protein